MPISRHARMTRTAISPRLAISSLLNTDLRVSLDAIFRGTLLASTLSGLGGALRASTLSGLGGALRAPLGPVVAPLVPRCALLPAPTPREVALRAILLPQSGRSSVPNVTGQKAHAPRAGRRSASSHPIKRGVAAGRSAQRGTSGATTGGGGRSAPDPKWRIESKLIGIKILMKVFVFDLLPYGENLEHLKNGATELPWPLEKKYFKPQVAVRTYAEHLDAWQLLDELGYDGVGFNEHHTSPYGLMNSPNLLAASAAQRTKRLKLLIYANLLPIHEPLRLAEEL